MKVVSMNDRQVCSSLAALTCQDVHQNTY